MYKGDEFMLYTNDPYGIKNYREKKNIKKEKEGKQELTLERIAQAIEEMNQRLEKIEKKLNN